MQKKRCADGCEMPSGAVGGRLACRRQSVPCCPCPLPRSSLRTALRLPSRLSPRSPPPGLLFLLPAVFLPSWCSTGCRRFLLQLRATAAARGVGFLLLLQRRRRLSCSPWPLVSQVPAVGGTGSACSCTIFGHPAPARRHGLDILPKFRRSARSFIICATDSPGSNPAVCTASWGHAMHSIHWLLRCPRLPRDGAALTTPVYNECLLRLRSRALALASAA